MEDRFDFTRGVLSKNNVTGNPMDLLMQWFARAKDRKVSEYHAMVLSTLGVDERISSRVVYARALTPQGVIFYTNYYSRKGSEALENNQVAINFFWKELEQQVRLEGVIKKVEDAVSDDYFNSRPRGSQIGAWASEQSQEVPNRKYLEERVQFYEEEFTDRDVPRPPHWGGYIILPDYVEFWQGRANRLHDRIIYEQEGSNWNIKRLAP